MASNGEACRLKGPSDCLNPRPERRRHALCRLYAWHVSSLTSSTPCWPRFLSPFHTSTHNPTTAPRTRRSSSEAPLGKGRESNAHVVASKTTITSTMRSSGTAPSGTRRRSGTIHRCISSSITYFLSSFLLLLATTPSTTTHAFVLPSCPGSSRRIHHPSFPLNSASAAAASSAAAGTPSPPSLPPPSSLNPREINQAILSAEGDAQALLSVTAQHVGGFDKVNCATMINRYGGKRRKLEMERKRIAVEWSISPPALHTLHTGSLASPLLSPLLPTEASKDEEGGKTSSNTSFPSFLNGRRNCCRSAMLAR